MLHVGTNGFERKRAYLNNGANSGCRWLQLDMFAMMSEVLLRRTEKRGRETSRLMCCEDGRGVVVENICLVRDAVTLGTLSDVFFWGEETVNCGLVATKALPQVCHLSNSVGGRRASVQGDKELGFERQGDKG